MSRTKYCTDCRWFKLELVTAPNTPLGANLANSLVMGRARIYFACTRPGMDYMTSAALLERGFIEEPDPWAHCGTVGRYFTAKPAPIKKDTYTTTIFKEDSL